MVRGAVAWWSQQLASLAPPWMSRWLLGGENRLVISVSASQNTADNDHVDLRLVQSQNTLSLGRFPFDRQGVSAMRDAISRIGNDFETFLEVPGNKILQKRILLPITVERDLPRVLSFEIDRETPFVPDEIYWAVAVEDRSRKLRQITVRLSLVQKRRVAPILALLKEAGLNPRALISDAITVPFGDGRGMSRNGSALGFRVSISGFFALAFIASALPFFRQELAIRQADYRIAMLQPAVDEAERLRPQITGSLAGGAGADLRDCAESLVLLADITAALPDDTALTDLVLHHRMLELVGRSAAPDGLIERLAGYPGFAEPAFSAPVTKTENSDQRLFSIKLALRAPL